MSEERGSYPSQKRDPLIHFWKSQLKRTSQTQYQL